MENYINSMSHLRRLEDTWPEYRSIPLQSFLSSLYESAKIVCVLNLPPHFRKILGKGSPHCFKGDAELTQLVFAAVA